MPRSCACWTARATVCVIRAAARGRLKDPAVRERQVRRMLADPRSHALVSNFANPADTMPDVIYDALWNGAANTSDPILPSAEWAGHQRIHQYLGGQNVTYGGVTVNIDQDFLDVQQGVTGGSPQASQAAAQSAGDVDAFFKGKDGKLWHDWYAPGSGWHGPVTLGGSLATQPSAVASVPGNVAVFAKGTNGRLLEASYAPGTNWTINKYRD